MLSPQAGAPATHRHYVWLLLLAHAGSATANGPHSDSDYSIGLRLLCRSPATLPRARRSPATLSRRLAPGSPTAYGSKKGAQTMLDTARAVRLACTDGVTLTLHGSPSTTGKKSKEASKADEGPLPTGDTIRSRSGSNAAQRLSDCEAKRPAEKSVERWLANCTANLPSDPNERSIRARPTCALSVPKCTRL